ncbi:MAG: hypothetical protein JO128_11880, partial [Alphaproteobacteria bacterium]|nr:hypothetical protein [Alphaproteobacteria bacterium]
MASSHRKLNTKQLVTLSEVYWDDAAKLAEILEELRSRLEPDAEALARTLTGRVHLLRTNPAAAREHPPPTQQVPDDERAPPPESPTHKRRRVAFAVLGAALVAGAAWFLWPHGASPPPAPGVSSGPEVALGGAPAEEAPKSPTEQSTPPSSASRRVTLERPDMPSRPDAGGGGGGGGGGGSSAGSDGSAARRSLAKPRAGEKEAPDATEPAEKDFTKETSELAAAETRPQRALAKTGEAVEKSAAASAAARSGAGKAEAGVAITDAQLTCYRTDSRSDTCGAPPGGGDASAPGGPAPSKRDEAAQAAPLASSGGGGAGSTPPSPTRAASRAGAPPGSSPASPAVAPPSSGGG